MHTGLAHDEAACFDVDFSHSSDGGPASAVGSIVISAKCRLSWWGASPTFFLLSEVRFQRCAETPRSLVKSPRSTPPSSSPWSSFLSTVCSPSRHSQPSSETFDLKLAPGYSISTLAPMLCVWQLHGGKAREKPGRGRGGEEAAGAASPRRGTRRMGGIGCPEAYGPRAAAAHGRACLLMMDCDGRVLAAASDP